jgi:hypothetical protein
MELDLASVLAQWATGGLAFCWVTTRRRVVGTGYGWLLRSVFATLAIGALAAGLADPDGGTAATVRDAATGAMALLATLALVSSVVHRADRDGDRPSTFDPALDILAPLAGTVALLATADVVGGPYALSASRLVVGALFLGAVTDSMLLGHWYLVQPGLSREPIKELVKWSAALWPLDVALLLVPTGMVSVLNGTIDDGYDGLLGVTWIVSALTTIGLLGVTWLALKERFYSAVMAATGLLYLAILTAFGTDVLARALLAS